MRCCLPNTKAIQKKKNETRKKCLPKNSLCFDRYALSITAAMTIVNVTVPCANLYFRICVRGCGGGCVVLCFFAHRKKKNENKIQKFCVFFFGKKKMTKIP